VRVSRVAIGTQQRSERPGFPQRYGDPVFFVGPNQEGRGIMMKGRNEVLTTEEACKYLRISRPTFLKLVHSDQIRARKVGKGWKVLKSELQAYLRIDEKSDFEMVMIP